MHMLYCTVYAILIVGELHGCGLANEIKTYEN